jgi:glutamate-5-semialdehyde dehydrogenase
MHKDKTMLLEDTFKKVKRASKSLALLSDQQRNEILLAVADAIIDYQERILTANEMDLAKMDPTNPLYDRLQLTSKRLADIAGDMRNVATCHRH